jgi:hypothetical protein
VIAWRADAPSGDELTVWSARKLERHFEDHHDGRLRRTKKVPTSLVAKEQAALLWNTQQKIPASEKIKAPLRRILFYVQFNENPWTEKIGKIIPRAVHILSRGDADQTQGGGAYCARLYFWFDIEWPLEVFKGANECKPADAGYVHINCLEFIIVLLQIAAVIEWLRSAPQTQIEAWFPNSLPDIPVLQVDTDNSTTEAWGKQGYLLFRPRTVPHLHPSSPHAGPRYEHQMQAPCRH